MNQPAATERIDVQALVDEAAGEEFQLENLADKENLTAEDLRDYLGDDAKDVSDEDLLKHWQETAGEGEGERQAPVTTPAADATPTEGAAPTAPAWDRPWKFHKGDAAVEDIEKLTAKELLEAAIGYKAGGADQKRTIDELVRLAQRVPLDEQRIHGLMENTRQLNQRIAELQKLEEDSKTWIWALQDSTGQRFLKLQEAWQNAAPAEARTPAVNVEEANQAGEVFYQETIWPHLAEMARTYSLDGNAPAPEVVQHLSRDLDRYFRQLIDAEGPAMSNPQYAAARVQQIIQYDIPAELQRVGYKSSSRTTPVARPVTPAAPAAPAAPSAEVTALKAELANMRTELAKAKASRAPGPGAGAVGGTPKVGPDFSKAKSFADILAVVRSPETQWDVE